MTFVVQTQSSMGSKPWGGSFCIQCESKMIRKVPGFSPFQVGQKCFVRAIFESARSIPHRERWFVSCTFAGDRIPRQSE